MVRNFIATLRRSHTSAAPGSSADTTALARRSNSNPDPTRSTKPQSNRHTTGPERTPTQDLSALVAGLGGVAVQERSSKPARPFPRTPSSNDAVSSTKEGPRKSIRRSVRFHRAPKQQDEPPSPAPARPPPPTPSAAAASSVASPPSPAPGDAAASEDSEVQVPVARYNCGFCPGCKRNAEIEPPVRSRRALNNVWHLTCFNCPVCSKPVRGTSSDALYSYRAWPYHRSCYYEWFGDRCEACGEWVPDRNDDQATGERHERMGKVWHTAHYACAMCKEKLDTKGRRGVDLQEYEDIPYCLRCYETVTKDKCAKCNRPFLDGKFVLGLSQKWHAEHFTCAKCSARLDPDNYKAVSGEAYCPAHAPRRVVGTCAVCERIIYDNENYFETAWGQVYCERHDRSLPSCEFCGTPVCRPRLSRKVMAAAAARRSGEEEADARSLAIPKPRPICDHCLDSALTEGTELKELFDRVRREMAELGVEITGAHVTVGLAIDQMEIASIANLYHRERDSATEVRPLGGGRYEYHIYVLEGLPREAVAAMLAHELLHIFVVEMQFPRRISPMVLEGMAQYAAYMYIRRNMGTGLSVDEEHRLDQIKNNDELIGGSGFKACAGAVRLVGSFDGVLEHVRRTRWFPQVESRSNRSSV